jgi:hypothetical protein
MDGRKDGQTDRGKTLYPPPPSGSGGIKIAKPEKTPKLTIYNFHVFCCRCTNILNILLVGDQLSPIFIGF